MKRVQIYVGPAIRNSNPNGDANSTGPINTIGQSMRALGISESLVYGSSSSLYDYAVENLDKAQAENLARRIGELEGYATKIEDWLP
ncbi:MAG: hypothetical protein KKF50_02575 [Nanoarchaeota archaeon]|nr:hypothetical protein [Nanoarchaeota archaeon]